jgi:hypothetical protein
VDKRFRGKTSPFFSIFVYLIVSVFLVFSFGAFAEEVPAPAPDLRSRKEVVITLACANLQSILRDFMTFFGHKPGFEPPGGDYKKWLIDGDGMRYSFSENGFPNGSFVVNENHNFTMPEEKLFTEICCKFMSGVYNISSLNSFYTVAEGLDGVYEYFFHKSFLNELEKEGRKTVSDSYASDTHSFHFSPDFKIAEYGENHLQVGNYIFPSSVGMPEWQWIVDNAVTTNNVDYQMAKYAGFLPYFSDNVGDIYVIFSDVYFDGGRYYGRYCEFFFPVYFYTGYGIGYCIGYSSMFFGSPDEQFKSSESSEYSPHIEFGNFVRDDKKFFAKFNLSVKDSADVYFYFPEFFLNTRTGEKVSVFDYPEAAKNFRFALLPYSESPNNDMIILGAVREHVLNAQFTPEEEVVMPEFPSEDIPDDAVISVDTNGVVRIDGVVVEDPILPPSPDLTTSPDATTSPNATTTPNATTSPDATTLPNATTSPDATTPPEVTSVPGNFTGVVKVDVNSGSNLGGFLGNIASAITNGFSDLIKFFKWLLFPSDDLFSNAIAQIKGVIDSKLSFYDEMHSEYISIFDMFSQASSDYRNNAPSLSVTLPGKVFGGEDVSVKVMDFGIFSEVIGLIRSFIVAVVYLRFILYFRKRIIKMFSPVSVVMRE